MSRPFKLRAVLRYLDRNLFSTSLKKKPYLLLLLLPPHSPGSQAIVKMLPITKWQFLVRIAALCWNFPRNLRSF